MLCPLLLIPRADGSGLIKLSDGHYEKMSVNEYALNLTCQLYLISWNYKKNIYVKYIPYILIERKKDQNANDTC